MLKSFVFILATVTVAAAETMPEPSASQVAPATAPTDPQIAMIAVVANNIDIDAGKLAIEKAQDKSVKELAEMMVRDHTTVNDQVNALAKKLGVSPQESAISTSLKSDADKTMEKLKKLSGTQFDKAYVENEVKFHTAVIDVVDKSLIPNAKNAELKSLLETSRPIFVAHLEHAKNVQTSLDK